MCETKICPVCKISKFYNEFHKSKRTKDKLAYSCKECKKQQDKNYYIKNKEKINNRGKAYHYEYRTIMNAKMRRYYKKNPLKTMLVNARLRAKRKNLEFNITEKDLIIPKRCPVLDIPIKIGVGTVCENSPSIDRINNSVGYIPGNVIIISFKANTIKNNATINELQKVIDFYRKIL